MTEKTNNTAPKKRSGKDSNDRADRLKNNLRANLQKRKSQIRARTTETNTDSTSENEE